MASTVGSDAQKSKSKTDAEAGAKFFEDAWTNAINKIKAKFNEPMQDPMRADAEGRFDLGCSKNGMKVGLRFKKHSRLNGQRN